MTSSETLDRVTFALPSKGALAESTLSFLQSCDLRVYKRNPRQYTASLPALPQVDVLFQRVLDIVYKIADATVQLGITGLDIVYEHPDDNLIVVHDNLGYGHCKLVLAVPESWIDVDHLVDLVDISLEFREIKRRNLRIATKYPVLTRRFLHEQGIHHFTLVESEGALEAAPTLGYADMIADLTATGTTLRENHLKPLIDGVILESQACLVANKNALTTQPWVRQIVRLLLELIDAAMQGKGYYSMSTNVLGQSAEAVARLVSSHPATRGLQGPTIAPMFTSTGQTDEQWYAVTVIVRSQDLLPAVEHLRAVGGVQTTVMPVRYVFMQESASNLRLEQLLSSQESLNSSAP